MNFDLPTSPLAPESHGISVDLTITPSENPYPIGELVLAFSVGSLKENSAVAKVLAYRDSEILISWVISSDKLWLPIENVYALGSKRIRTLKYPELLASAKKNKTNKETASTPSLFRELHDEGISPPPKPTVTKEPKEPSALYKEILAADTLADRNLGSHLHYLEHFISEKTRQRILVASNEASSSISTILFI